MKKTLILVLILVFGLISTCMSVICIPGEARADGRISFADPQMEGAVREALGIGETEPIPEEMALTLTSLNASSNGIQNLDGLENFINLSELNLENNLIDNVSVLENLTNLQWLDLGNNFISDVAPLDKLSNLQWLNLGNNPVGNIAPLSKLKNLKWLGLLGILMNNLASDPNSTWLNGGGGEGGGEGTILDIWNSFTDSFGNLANQGNLPIQPYWEGGNFLNNTGTLNEYWQTQMDYWYQTLGDIRSLGGDPNVPWADFGSNFMDTIFNMTGNWQNGSQIWNSLLDEFNSRLTPPGITPESNGYDGENQANGPENLAPFYENLPWVYFFNNRPTWSDYSGSLQNSWSSYVNGLPWVYFYKNLPYWPRYSGNPSYRPGGGDSIYYYGESYTQDLPGNNFDHQTTVPVYEPGKRLRQILGR